MELSAQALIQLLEKRFAKNAHRHPGIAWPGVQVKLVAAVAQLSPKLAALLHMETTAASPM